MFLFYERLFSVGLSIRAVWCNPRKKKYIYKKRMKISKEFFEEICRMKFRTTVNKTYSHLRKKKYEETNAETETYKQKLHTKFKF